MPMVEVLDVQPKQLDVKRKRAFAWKAREIVQEVLKVNPAQFRLNYNHVEPENGHAYLLDQLGASG